MNLDLSTIVLGGFIGLIGLALVSYGRKEVRIPHIVVGLILLVYPYFVGNWIAIVGNRGRAHRGPDGGIPSGLLRPVGSRLLTTPAAGARGRAASVSSSAGRSARVRQYVIGKIGAPLRAGLLEIGGAGDAGEHERRDHALPGGPCPMSVLIRSPMKRVCAAGTPVTSASTSARAKTGLAHEDRFPLGRGRDRRHHRPRPRAAARRGSGRWGRGWCRRRGRPPGWPPGPGQERRR